MVLHSIQQGLIHFVCCDRGMANRQAYCEEKVLHIRTPPSCKEHCVHQHGLQNQMQVHAHTNVRHAGKNSLLDMCVYHSTLVSKNYTQPSVHIHCLTID